jgi:hypothetical protein
LNPCYGRRFFVITTVTGGSEGTVARIDRFEGNGPGTPSIARQLALAPEAERLLSHLRETLPNGHEDLLAAPRGPACRVIRPAFLSQACDVVESSLEETVVGRYDEPLLGGEDQRSCGLGTELR